MNIVQCWIEHPVRELDQTFTYLCTEDLKPGMRVQVTFGGRPAVGFVESVEKTDETMEEITAHSPYKLRMIDDVIDADPLITEELHDLAMWMAETTLSTRISCFQAMLPAKIKPITSSRHVAMEKWCRCSENEVEMTPKQLAAFLYVRAHEPLKYHELRDLYPNQARSLVEKNAVILFEKEREAGTNIFQNRSIPPELTDEQKKAMLEIESSNDQVFLIHGVTGSGKTEIYLQMAQRALENGKQVLILVPEIGLTPQMIERVGERFGVDLAIYHSALNDQEKYEQYKKISTGKASIVIGTRSAVFLPFRNLGLIAMDEEHDNSYKQENQPAYHCRDIAIWRGKYHHCKVLLGSATPCLESYARGIKGVYHLITLKHRINDTMPETVLVPLKDSLKKGESYILTETLKENMRETLNRKEQIILLLNRRGYNTQLRCRSCKAVLVCPHCDLAMSYHRDENMLKCHACGTVMRIPRKCPVCGEAAGFTSYGFGTEKLEDEVRNEFPEARVLRMDADTTTRKNSHEKILKSFGNHEADILLGTQMIAKGLDYPDVTLVGILNGDEGIGRNDYRSCETTFDLLMQAGGRSGRAAKSGKVIMQVFDPEHYAVQCAVHQDYEGFFREEMKFRHAGQYPPYTYLIALTIVSVDQKKADNAALWLKQNLVGHYKTIGIISLLKIQDRCRNRILLKGKDLEEMRTDIRRLFEGHERSYLADIRIDVNPVVLD